MALTGIRGTSGRLRSGGRTLAGLQGWEAESLGGSAYRVRVIDCHRDVFWWELRAQLPLCLELDFGRVGLRGPATLESDDPLVLVVTMEGEAHSA